MRIHALLLPLALYSAAVTADSFSPSHPAFTQINKAMTDSFRMQQQLMRMPTPPDRFKRENKETPPPQGEAEKVDRRQAESVITPQAQPRPDEQSD
ncbi:hypothetical protein JD974_22690 [Chromobacterium haemolyticum]|uniref:DUF4148 domain-containing protein n=1 Tax=Chromobacterium haemolyticum TaxID=394935 RepID=A0ABS3GTH6_9NEIS|nr:hypothetical protein [Chromobacterium haemolyticum]MBK0417222.1 hypothetical protein [Chromobacterium haemolyticum]MBO0418347.1 hypothetical protein [Chromobacterium haemolyticum]MBO0501672.1 hypothetical protein [Chromobacterium haemolyticum]